jgi:prepilin-type N-terminal cleavage/methylation domain-containing protein
MDSLKKNNFGFTLMEMLVSLIIVASIMLVVCNLFYVIFMTASSRDNLLQLQTAKTQMQVEVFFGNNAEISQDNMTLSFVTINNEYIEYVFEDGKLMRYVDGSGYQVVLNVVLGGTFYFWNGNIYMNVDFENGESYEIFLGPYNR